MKKILVLLVGVCFSLTQLSGQDPTFVKGDKVANFGLGLGSTLAFGSTLIPPLSASFEVGVVDNIIEKGVIGIGGFVGFSSYRFPFSDYRASNISIGPRGTFHYPFVDKLDTYGGLMIGYNVYSDNDPLDVYNYGQVVSSFFIGGRYYFSDFFAAMLELGYGVFNINLGVALKF